MQHYRYKHLFTKSSNGQRKPLSGLGLILDKQPEIQVHLLAFIFFFFSYQKVVLNSDSLAFPDLISRPAAVLHFFFPYLSRSILIIFYFRLFLIAPITVVSEQLIFSTVLIFKIPKCNCMRSKGSTIIPILYLNN